MDEEGMYSFNDTVPPPPSPLDDEEQFFWSPSPNDKAVCRPEFSASYNDYEGLVNYITSRYVIKISELKDKRSLSPSPER
jgi:hypothetical protein